MGNFQGGDNRGGGFRGGNSGGKPSFQKKSWSGDSRGGDRRDAPMYKATCSECGKSCEVPFRPSGDKPVFCNDCFSSKRDGGDRGPRRDFGDRAPKRDFNSRPSAPFARPAPSQDDTKRQLAEISVKLDRLTNAIEKFTQTKGENSTPKFISKVVPEAVKIPTTFRADAKAKKEVKVKAIVKKVVKKVSKKK